MLSEIMKKKLIKHFQFQDSNKDGLVEQADWEKCAQNLAEIRGWAFDSSEYKAILAKHIDIWTNNWLPADSDGDGKVSQEEYLNLAMQSQTENKQSYLDKLYDLFGAIFDIIDLYGKGEIILDDYREFFRAWGVDEDLAQGAFSSIDLNKDGILKRMSFIQFGADFFTNNDEFGFGNLMFGPLD